MKCIECELFENLADADSVPYGRCDEDNMILNANKDVECYHFISKAECERMRKQREDELAAKKENAAEIIEIMQTWRDRCNPIVLDYAIDTIKKYWNI